MTDTTVTDGAKDKLVVTKDNDTDTDNSCGVFFSDSDEFERLKAMAEGKKSEETGGYGVEGDASMSVSGSSNGYYFSDADEFQRAKEQAEQAGMESDNGPLFEKESSENDDYDCEMKNGQEETGVGVENKNSGTAETETDHAAFGDDPVDDPVDDNSSESEMETLETKEQEEGEIKREDTVTKNETGEKEKETEDVVKRVPAETEMVDADLDTAVIDGIVETVNDTAEKAENVDTNVINIPGDERDGGNMSESEDDGNTTCGEDGESTTEGTFAGFSGFSAALKSGSASASTSGSGSDTDRYILFLERKLVTDAQYSVSFGVYVSSSNAIQIVNNQL